MRMISCLVLTICTIATIHCSFEESLGLLSQQLEKVVQSIPWVNPKCFKIIVKTFNELVKVDHIQLDYDCGLVGEQWFLEEFEHLRDHRKRVFDSMKDAIKLLFEIFIGRDKNFSSYIHKEVYLPTGSEFKERGEISGPVSGLVQGIPGCHFLVNDAIILLFYNESQHPGSWLNDYGSTIQTEAGKKKWHTFMEEFRKLMRTKYGWPF